MKQSRKEEWDYSDAEKLHCRNCRQILLPQRDPQDWLGPCQKKSGYGITDKGKKLHAPAVSLGEAYRRQVRRARVKREKWQRQRLRDYAQTHADSIWAAEQSHSREICHPGKDKNIELKRELSQHRAGAHRQRRRKERFPEGDVEAQWNAGIKARHHDVIKTPEQHVRRKMDGNEAKQSEMKLYDYEDQT